MNIFDFMNIWQQALAFSVMTCAVMNTHAHYPFVAPLSYQTFNNHSAIVAGFYDNPFASEIAIKNFKFHYHTPMGEKLYIGDSAWVNSKTLSSYSLENKLDGTYRIRGEKQGNHARYALDGKQWKPFIQATPKAHQPVNNTVFYAKDLKKNTLQKTVESTEIIESFVSRRKISQHVIQHLHNGFDIQFITHPNAFKKSQAIQLKLLDDKKGIANLKVEILAQTTDFSRDAKVYKTLTTDTNGLLNFSIDEKGQYLMKVDYQQPFELKTDTLKRYKYTLAFNVID